MVILTFLSFHQLPGPFTLYIKVYSIGLFAFKPLRHCAGFNFLFVFLLVLGFFFFGIRTALVT